MSTTTATIERPTTATVARPRRWTDTKGAAAHIGCSPSTLNDWRCDGIKRIPFHRIGRCIRYDLNEVDDAIAGTNQEASPPRHATPA